MTASGNAADGIPRGNIRGGRDPACWEGPGPRCSITPRTSHVPAGLAARVISRQRDDFRVRSDDLFGVLLEQVGG